MLACHELSLSSIPAQYKTGMKTHTWYPSTGELKTAGSRVQDHPWLHSKFQASLGYKEQSSQITAREFFLCHNVCAVVGDTARAHEGNRTEEVRVNEFEKTRWLEFIS